MITFFALQNIACQTCVKLREDRDESGNIFTFFALQNIACQSVKLRDDVDSEEKWVHAKENSLVWQVTYFLLCVDQWRNLSH